MNELDSVLALLECGDWNRTHSREIVIKMDHGFESGGGWKNQYTISFIVQESAGVVDPARAVTQVSCSGGSIENAAEKLVRSIPDVLNRNFLDNPLKNPALARGSEDRSDG